MKLRHFVHILAVTLALSGYSAWSLAVRERGSAWRPDASDEAVAGIPVIDGKEAEALWHEPSTLFVDVRDRGDYQVGHVAGAVNLPDGDFKEAFPGLKARLERAQTLVLYCKSIDCAKSLWSALRLRHEGLHQAVIYAEGWYEWTDRGWPTATGK